MNPISQPVQLTQLNPVSPIRVTSVAPRDKLTYLHSFTIHYTTKSGQEREWELVSRQGLQRLNQEIFQGASFTDGAMMIATTKDKKKIVLIREFRVTAGKYVFALPAGLIDPGETIEEAAIREFKEETGMTFEPIYTAVERYASIGIINEKINLVYGYFTGEPSKEYQSDNEDADVVLIDKEAAIYLLKHEEVPVRTALILENLFALNPFLNPA